ncbi:hypothetical protein BV20DRAFT_965355 [Pilatotrama ljubarskyi]|nr:hypothetical protein BV20DRAFT_965355 [Pilatotrama ljubarskyi]
METAYGYLWHNRRWRKLRSELILQSYEGIGTKNTALDELRRMARCTRCQLTTVRVGERRHLAFSPTPRSPSLCRSLARLGLHMPSPTQETFAMSNMDSKHRSATPSSSGARGNVVDHDAPNGETPVRARVLMWDSPA